MNGIECGEDIAAHYNKGHLCFLLHKYYNSGIAHIKISNTFDALLNSNTITNIEL